MLLTMICEGRELHGETGSFSQPTDMALLVQLVVGEFQFVEVDDDGGPVGAEGRGVRVDVEPGGGTLLLKAADPASIVLVAILVDGSHVHEKDVGDVWLQVVELHFDGREHPPAPASHYHLCPYGIKQLPEISAAQHGRGWAVRAVDTAHPLPHLL
jgi:hypothetical protein